MSATSIEINEYQPSDESKIVDGFREMVKLVLARGDTGITMRLFAGCRGIFIDGDQKLVNDM